MKKLLSVVLTLVMLLSLIPAAFAAGPTKDRNAKLTVTPGQIVLEPGVAEHGSAELVASIKGGTADAEGSSEVTYTFTCASEAVALQDGSAANKKTVLAVTAGTAKITVRADWTDKAGKEYYTEKTVPVTVREMTLKEESLTLGVGGTYQLTAEVAPKNSSLTWSSSNIKVASVSSNGLVNARSAGTATITVKCGNIEDSCEVTVLAVKKLTIDKTKLELAVGDTPVALVATVDPAEATVLWSSSDEKVATVDENGVVTPVAGGTATITAKCGNKSVTCKVTVVGIKKLSYNATMSLGSSQTITATVYPTSGYTVEWESNDENVVKFKSSSAGVKQTLLAMGTGTATITATMYKRSGGTKTAVATQNFDIEVTENIITYSTTTTFTFGNGSNSIYSQISNALSTLYGSSSGSAIETVIVTPTGLSGLGTGNGTLYKGNSNSTANKIIDTTELTRSEFSNLRFVPGRNGGSYTLEYTAYTKNNDVLSGTIIIYSIKQADEARVTLNSGVSTYEFNSTVGIKEYESLYSQVVRQLPGDRAASYIVFSSISGGTVSVPTGLSSTAIKANEKYDMSTFASMSYKGTGSFSANYSIYDANNAVIMTGAIRIGGSVSMSMYTSSGATVPFNESEFRQFWRTAYPGGSLSYVVFSLPVGGTIRNNGVALTYTTADTKFYANTTGTGSLSAASYQAPTVSSYGKYTINFTAYGSAGSYSGTTSLSGSITVYVTKNPAAAVNYSTQVNVSKVFSSTDFYNAITNTLGVSTTNWNVTFDRLPASTAGKLLSNFYSNTSYTEAVAGTYYNYSELNSFRFVPYTGYTGNVTIPFTVYISGEKIFSSSVVIKVGSGATYNCTSEGAAMQLVTFYNSQDTDPVASVSFQQPSVGKLYYNYTGGSGTLVKSSDIYYTNASLVSSTYALPLTSVKYVPKANYSGSVTINYTATTRSGMTYSSTLTIQVSSKTQSARFADVDRTFNWAADSVDFMYNYGIVKGVDTAMTKFNPNGKMSRGDLVLILYRMAGSPSVSGVSNPFSDVNTTHYYYNAILWAYNKGVVSGVGGGKFAPDRAVTREQIATILYQYNTKILGNGNSGSASLNGYKDAGKVSSYATAAMQWAVGNGYVTGTTTTTLSPASTATRAQVAVMLHRLLTY